MMELIKVPSIKKEKDQEKVNLSGTMDKFMKETGKKEKNTDMVLGRVQKETAMRGSGWTADNKEMASISINLVFTKDNFWIV